MIVILSKLTLKNNARSFSLSAENPTGEKGMGGRSVDGAAASCARELGIGWKISPMINIEPGKKAVIADIKGQGAIKHFWITDGALLCPGKLTPVQAGRQIILRIYFDGHENPAVEAPLSDFFAMADYNEFRQLTSLPICVNPKRGMNCYFEMPYFKSFRFELENISPYTYQIYYQIDCEEKEISPDSLYFHAQFRRVNPLPYKTPYVILDNIKGNGQYVGTYINWGNKSNGWWGEGEIKFYIDGDDEFPTICGTGVEDYFCGAYCFLDDDGSGKSKHIEYSTPYCGMSKVSKTDEALKSQRYFDMYRWHITDPIYFKEDLKVTIQALGWRSGGRYLPLQEDISSVAYWYSDTLDDEYPEFPDANALEIIYCS